MSGVGTVRIGISGWTYGGWRGTFYPKGLSHAGELAYASREVETIEINGTFYGLQRPEVFARWHDETREGFLFAVKAPRIRLSKVDLPAPLRPTSPTLLPAGICALASFNSARPPMR